MSHEVQETGEAALLVEDESIAGFREEIASLRRAQLRAEERAAAVRDVIQTIARTTFDLDAVLQTVVDRAVELCGADNGNIVAAGERPHCS